MPPSVRLRLSRQNSLLSHRHDLFKSSQCPYATVAAAAAVATTTTPAPSIHQMTTPISPTPRYASVQPPSHRRPEFRKSQLLRSYVSLLHSTPLILLFQHNNLRSIEWFAIRRELASAMQRLDQSLIADGREASATGSQVKLQVIRTTIFEPALRIADFYRPPPPPSPEALRNLTIASEKDDPTLTHALSESAYEAVRKKKGRHPLTPLLTGSLALLAMPTVSPQHLKAAFQILAPQAPGFPAPTRRANPGYWDPAVQDGLKKLMLLGARVEGKVFDMDATRWMAGIEGGLEGLRAQLVYMLQGVGAGITGALEGASRNLYFTVESRRQMLEEEAKPTDMAK
jgi:large subunit ribosomal protein L10